MLGPSTTALMRNLCARHGEPAQARRRDHRHRLRPRIEHRPLAAAEGARRRDHDLVASIRRRCEIDLADLDALLSPRTKLVCVTHASNILGTINPIAEIARLRACARRPDRRGRGGLCAASRGRCRGARTSITTSSVLQGLRPAFRRHVRQIRPLLELTGLYHYFYGRDKVPHKLEPGNCNYELAWGCTGIVDYLDALGGGTGDRAAIDAARFDAIAAQRKRWASGCSPTCATATMCASSGTAQRTGPGACPTITFKVGGRDSAEIVPRRRRPPDRHPLRRFPFAPPDREARACAAGNGVVRVSMVHYNTLAEVDRLVVALDQALP